MEKAWQSIWRALGDHHKPLESPVIPVGQWIRPLTTRSGAAFSFLPRVRRSPTVYFVLVDPSVASSSLLPCPPFRYRSFGQKKAISRRLSRPRQPPNCAKLRQVASKQCLTHFTSYSVHQYTHNTTFSPPHYITEHTTTHTNNQFNNAESLQPIPDKG